MGYTIALSTLAYCAITYNVASDVGTLIDHATIPMLQIAPLCPLNASLYEIY